MKPDNIGVTEDMKLKLFDFGLMTCVKRPALASDVYQLSGCTGSLRYMAPEVPADVLVMHLSLNLTVSHVC